MNAGRDMLISTSLPITVQRTQGDSARIPGTLVGNIHDEFLILSGLKDIDLQIGEQIVVRMVHESSVYGYQSSVQGIIEAPVKMFVISYPQRVESVNLRKSERLKVFFPASVRAPVNPPAQDLQILSGMLLNISSGGCCFSSKRQVQTSSRISLSFSFPGETHVYNVRGVVLVTLAGDGVYAQRVQWLKEGPDQPVLAAIGRWIEQNVPFALVPRDKSSAA
jgi:hypothetical protein